MKLDALVANHKGTRLGFRLINNQLIDSKMFELVSFSFSFQFFHLKRIKNLLFST